MASLRGGFTTRASCLFAAGLTAIVCGFALGEVNLLRAGVLAAAIPCVASVAVQRARVRIGNKRSAAPDHIDAGESVTVSLTVTNGSSLRTTTLMLEDQLPEALLGNARFVLDPLRNRESRTVTYRIPELSRGRYRIGPLRVRLTDPFGLIDISRSFNTTSEFVVTPTVDPVGVVVLPRADDRGGSGSSHSIGSHGADDASTREYRIGDDLRKIHWRSTARTGSMMVRQEERPWQGQAAVLLDLRSGAHVSGPLLDGDPLDPRLTSSAEWAISAAASIGAYAIHGGQRFTLAADPTQRLPMRFDQRTALLNYLADVAPHRIADLDPLLAQLRRPSSTTSTVAILGRLDRAALALLSGAAPRGQELSPAALVLDVDSWSGTAAAESLNPDTVASALYNTGWRVAVARRGDSISSAWQTLLGHRTPEMQ